MHTLKKCSPILKFRLANIRIISYAYNKIFIIFGGFSTIILILKYSKWANKYINLDFIFIDKILPIIALFSLLSFILLFFLSTIKLYYHITRKKIINITINNLIFSNKFKLIVKRIYNIKILLISIFGT